MLYLVAFIALILLFGAGAVRNFLLAVIATITFSGSLAIISINTGWPAWATLLIVILPIAVILFIWFQIEEFHGKS